MRSMSTTRSHFRCTFGSPQLDHKSLAVCAMGDGHSRPLAHWSSTKEVFACCNQLLQQAGGRISMCQYQRQRCLQVRPDNGPQFDSVIFRTFCLYLNIKNLYSTPRYSHSNRQVKATNKTLLNVLKKRLEGAKEKWVNELPGVLWAYQTTSR